MAVVSVFAGVQGVWMWGWGVRSDSKKQGNRGHGVSTEIKKEREETPLQTAKRIMGRELGLAGRKRLI